MELSNARSQKKLIGPCVICGAEGVEVKFRRFTEDAYRKATQHGTLASTWVLNVSQFCHTHYMVYIVHGTDKGSETSENAVPSKRRWIQGEAVTEQVDRDDSQQELIMETSEVSDNGRIKEIDFIECVRSMAQIFYTREKKERKVPVYDWKLLRLELESKDIGLKPFLNLLEKLINPSGRGLVDHTISQRQKGLSFLCYFLAGIGNKHISSLKKDIAMFLNHSGTSDQAIDTLSNMQLSSTSRENRREKNIISSIHRDNVTRDLVKYQTNAIIVNIDDYHNIHGLRIPTTTSTSTVAHMTTVLAITIPTATAIPRNVEDNVYASIHNPRIVDNNILISKIEDRFMALLSQSFNDRFAKRNALSENDLLDNLTVHCYDIDIHEKRHNRQLNNTLLIDFVELNLHSTEAYIKAMETFASFPEFHEYLQRNVIPLVADWPGQILPRKAITMQRRQQQSQKNIQTGKIPECVSSFIPIMGPLHVSLNSRETVMLLFYDFFNLAYKCIFGKNKKLANKPRPWRINLLLQLMSDAWKNVAPYIMRKFDFSCSRDVEYLTLKSLLDDTIPLVLNVYATIFRSGDWDGYIEACVRIWCLFARFKRRNYNKAPLFFLSDVWYWESINHPILEILRKHLVSFSDYPVENYHSLIRRQTRETDTPEQLSRTARVINCLRHDNVFRDTFVSSTRYPYRKEDLIGLTNRASIFLLELFTDVKNNTGKSKWTKRDRNKFSCHLATLNIDVDQRHLPMAFSSEYPPFDPSEKCHLQDSCKMLQSTSDHFVSLPCGHVYHRLCLQYLEYKCLHCLKYIKDEINDNVKSIIKRLTGEDNNNPQIDINQENVVQSADDEPEDLAQQPLFNLETTDNSNQHLKDL